MFKGRLRCSSLGSCCNLNYLIMKCWDVIKDDGLLIHSSSNFIRLSLQYTRVCGGQFTIPQLCLEGLCLWMFCIRPLQMTVTAVMMCHQRHVNKPSDSINSCNPNISLALLRLFLPQQIVVFFPSCIRMIDERRCRGDG